MADGEVVIDITGDDAGFKKTVSGLGKVAAAGMVGVAALAAAIIGVGAAGINASVQFNKGMANVASLIPGNIDRVNELKTTVQDMAVSFGKDTADLSAGLYQTISAFGDTSDTAKILETNVKAAAAGVATTADAINLTSAVTKAYGDTSAVAVAQVSDLALMTVRLGQTTFPELAGSIGVVTPLMKNLGVSQQELFAGFATLTGVTGGAAEVATQTRGALQALMAPTADATAAMKAAGYADVEAMIAKEGLAGSMKILVDAAEKSGKPLQSYIGSIEGQTYALAVAGPQAADYANKLEQMKNASGATDAAFKEQTSGINALGFAFDQLKQVGVTSLQDLGDALGNAFGGQIIQGVDALKGGLSDLIAGLAAIMNGGDGGAQLAKGIGSIIGLLSGIITQAAPVLITTLAQLVVVLANAIPGMLPVVVSAILAGLLSLVDVLPTVIPALIGGFVTTLAQVAGALVAALPDVVNSLVSAIVSAIPVLLLGAVQLFGVLAQALPTVLPQVITALMGGINQIVSMLPSLLPMLLTAAIQLFMALVTALPMISTSLISGIVLLIGTVIQLLPTLVPMLVTAAIQLFLAIVRALPIILPQLQRASMTLILAVIQLLPTLIPMLLNAAIGLFSAFAKAVPAVGPALSESFRSLMRQGIANLKEFAADFPRVGREMIDGLIRGIVGGQGALFASIKDAARAAVQAAKDFLKIKSPSKVMALVGRMMDEGWAGGITDNAKTLISTVGDTAQRMVDAARNSDLSQALSASPGYVPAGYRPAMGSAALAAAGAFSGAVAGPTNQDNSITVNNYQPARGYLEQVQAIEHWRSEVIR